MCTLYLYYARHFVCSWILDTKNVSVSVRCVCAAHTTPKPCCLLKVEIVYINCLFYIFIYIWSSIYPFCLSRFLHTCCRCIMYHTHTSLFLVSFCRCRPLSAFRYYILPVVLACSFIAPLISCAVVFLLPRLFR
jgi:hypothetical protein